MSVLVNSKNIYLSTQPSSILGGRDDTFNRFRACLNNIPLQTKNDQYAKISLIDFNAYRNFYLVHKYNNLVYVKCKLNTVQQPFTPIRLTSKDYGNITDIGLEFAKKLTTYFDGLGGAVNIIDPVAADISPSDNYIKGQTGNGVFGVTLKNTGGVAHTISDVIIQTRNYENVADPDDFGDSYALLGGERLSQASDTAFSFTANTTAVASDITITGLYPMQLSTNAYLYLNCAEVQTNLESENFSAAANLNNDTHIVGSQILAKIPIQNQFASIKSDMSTPHFIFSDNRNISELMFSITDQHGRTIDTTSFNDIETKGNLFCEMTINYQVYTKGIGQPQNNNVEQNIIGRIQNGGIS